MNNSIHDIFSDKIGLKTWGDFWFLLCGFLDDFKRNPIYSRLEKEPDLNDPHMGSFLAASAEMLAYEYSLPIPDWVFLKKYYLNEPFFPGKFKGDYNIFLLRESPLEFRSRNIFVSSNVLSRV